MISVNALVIDLVTRFSAEEERVVDLLHRKVPKIVIGAMQARNASPFTEELIKAN